MTGGQITITSGSSLLTGTGGKIMVTTGSGMFASF